MLNGAGGAVKGCPRVLVTVTMLIDVIGVTTAVVVVYATPGTLGWKGGGANGRPRVLVAVTVLVVKIEVVARTVVVVYE